MGDLVKTTPYSEITATVELLDRLGVTTDDLATFRKTSSWKQAIIGNIFKSDPFLWALLEIEANAKKLGFTEADWQVLAKSEEKISLVLSLIRLETRQNGNIINCDANPFCPDGWEVVEHKKGGQMKWDMVKQAGALYLSKKQEGGVIRGNKLRKEVENQPVLNANILDYLLANPHLIPEEWKGKYVFFWGTIYRYSDGSLVVRCLRWDGDKWRWYYSWLDYGFDSGGPAALRAS